MYMRGVDECQAYFFGDLLLGGLTTAGSFFTARLEPGLRARRDRRQLLDGVLAVLYGLVASWTFRHRRRGIGLAARCGVAAAPAARDERSAAPDQGEPCGPPQNHLSLHSKTG